MKTSELIGGRLDYWVAKAEGRAVDYHDLSAHGGDFVTVVDTEQSGWVSWSPSRAWTDGGPIIEREKIISWATVVYIESADSKELDDELHQWAALHPKSRGLGGWTDGLGSVDVTSHDGMRGPTLLIAAMRAFVASKFGDEVVDNP